ncbi:DUF4277 domain-containing protein [Streptomyces sp. ISL-100]|uniref:DUF4277 domain-containing protein n=1 Tax=Streptomyces sp. ISL-100 TaxID=2819173 RepID=UPI0020358DCB|nr:DUF4277 domain-containing protein [Streptomyces sp. ISL-100]
MEVVIESVVTKRLGALPVAAEFLRRLDVAGIVDGLCPPDLRADLTHGQVIEVLVENRLTAPASLFRVGDWAREWAVVVSTEYDPLAPDGKQVDEPMHAATGVRADQRATSVPAPSAPWSTNPIGGYRTRQRPVSRDAPRPGRPGRLRSPARRVRGCLAGQPPLGSEATGLDTAHPGLRDHHPAAAPDTEARVGPDTLPHGEVPPTGAGTRASTILLLDGERRSSLIRSQSNSPHHEARG